MPDDGARAATDHLRKELAAGRPLPVLDSEYPLVPGEVLHAGIEAHVWWHGRIDASYLRASFVSFLSPGMLALTAGMSALGNHRRRRQAAAASAPQWHHQGYAPILLTNHRLLLVLEPDPLSLPLADIDRPTVDGTARLNLHSPIGPISLDDRWVPYLTAALDHLLAQTPAGHRRPEAVGS